MTKFPKQVAKARERDADFIKIPLGMSSDSQHMLINTAEQASSLPPAREAYTESWAATGIQDWGAAALTWLLLLETFWGHFDNQI